MLLRRVSDADAALDCAIVGVEIGCWLHPAHTGRNHATGGVPRRLGFTEIACRTPPREPACGNSTWCGELRRQQTIKRPVRLSPSE